MGESNGRDGRKEEERSMERMGEGRSKGRERGMEEGGNGRKKEGKMEWNGRKEGTIEGPFVDNQSMPRSRYRGPIAP